MTWAILVPRKGTEFPWIARRAAKFIDQLGRNRVTLRCDNQRLRRCQGKLHKLIKMVARLCQGDHQLEREPVQRNHRTHGGTRGWLGEKLHGASYWRQRPA